MEVAGPGGGNSSYACYPRGGGPSLPVITDPAAVFNTAFGTKTVDPLTLRRRASTLDVVTKGISSYKRQIPADDWRKLEMHLQAVRELELDLQPVKACSSAKYPPAAGTHEADPEKTRRLIDIMVQILACDVTRTITFASSMSSWSGPAAFSPVNFPSGSLHSLSHGNDNGTGAVWSDLGPKINKWSWDNHAYLLQKLSEVREADGTTLLDNTLVLGISEFSESSVHTVQSLPTVLTGSARGYFKTGRFLSPDRNNNDLFVSIANAMGVPLTTFGHPSMVRGPIQEMRS
jgi:hypothetical protein